MFEQTWESMISGFEVSEPRKTGWLAASLLKEVLKSITSMTFNRVEHMRFPKWGPRQTGWLPAKLLDEVTKLA